MIAANQWLINNVAVSEYRIKDVIAFPTHVGVNRLHPCESSGMQT